MLQPKRFLFSAALLALALSVTMYAGNAEAVYVGDGAVLNPTTGAFQDPTDGICVTGIQADGTFLVDSTVHSRPDCIAKTFPAYTTQAACGNTANSDGAHFWASTCVDASGNGISLAGLDRNANICKQKGGTWKSACTSAFQTMGTSGDGTAGFCATTMRLNNYDAATCPSTTNTVGYSYSTTNGCTYSYGITGVANGAMRRPDGTTATAAGAFVDLSGITNMGACLLVGGGWNNYVIKTTTESVPTTPVASSIADRHHECARRLPRLPQQHHTVQRLCGEMEIRLSQDRPQEHAAESDPRHELGRT